MNIVTGWQKIWLRIKTWNNRLQPIHRLYLIALLALGLFQGLISLIVLLASPHMPVGSR